MPAIDLTALPKALYLTEEEALALLDICVDSEVEFDPVKEQAVGRLSDMCRNFLRSRTAYDDCARDQRFAARAA